MAIKTEGETGKEEEAITSTDPSTTMGTEDRTITGTASKTTTIKGDNTKTTEEVMLCSAERKSSLAVRNPGDSSIEISKTLK